MTLKRQVEQMARNAKWLIGEIKEEALEAAAIAEDARNEDYVEGRMV